MVSAFRALSIFLLLHRVFHAVEKHLRQVSLVDKSLIKLQNEKLVIIIP